MGLYVIVNSLLVIPFLLVLFDSFFRALFLGVAGFSKRRSRLEVRSEASDLHLLILVLAHNEQRIIARTLDLIQSQIAGDSSVTLALLADNCTDDTVELANQSRVRVFVRSDGDAGKGRALSWFVSHTADDLAQYDLIAILDADTMISVDFCEKVYCAFDAKYVQIVQSFVEPLNPDEFSLATLAAYSEILSQKIDDEARSRLGWTIPLRGTGMVFRRELFTRVCLGLKTQVDDIEISVRLAEMKAPVTYFPLARIFDPKSASVLGLAKQRGRWLKGQRDVWNGLQHKTRTLLRLGFPGWSLLHALLFKPKMALIVIKFALLMVFSSPGLDPYMILRGIVIFSLIVDLLYYFIGLGFVTNPRSYLLSFLGAPLYLGMWIVGWFFSFGKLGQWLRSRE